MKCHNPNCPNETTNPKYCSSSCAAKVNNSTKPKRLPTGKCKYCNSPLAKSKWYCNEECREKYHAINKLNIYRDKYSDLTLQDLIFDSKDQNKYVRLRRNAQLTYKYSGKPYQCHNCGYDKHVEICHIKAISSYSIDTPLSVINDIDNLIALCPNCHWEFDHGILNLPKRF